MAEEQKRPGRLTNTPQHNVGAYGEGRSEERAPDGLPTWADPHPPEEEKPYRAPHPGGVHSRHDMNRVNDAVTDGTPKPQPHNAETEKPTSPGS